MRRISKQIDASDSFNLLTFSIIIFWQHFMEEDRTF